jgi:hypothetical protein
MYKKVYLDGIKFTSKQMRFGSKMAEQRESDELDEHFKMFLPKYPRREYEMRVEVDFEKNKKLELLGRFDGVDFRRHVIGDDKTGVTEWTQAKADKLEQLTFYALIYWKSKKVIPKLELNWIETEIVAGVVRATGKVVCFKTTRTMQDLLKLLSEINSVWRGIIKLCEKEFAKVV